MQKFGGTCFYFGGTGCDFATRPQKMEGEISTAEGNDQKFALPIQKFAAKLSVRGGTISLFAARERMAAGGISKREGKIGGFSFKGGLVEWVLRHSFAFLPQPFNNSKPLIIFIEYG